MKYIISYYLIKPLYKYINILLLISVFKENKKKNFWI